MFKISINLDSSDISEESEKSINVINHINQNSDRIINESRPLRKTYSFNQHITDVSKKEKSYVELNQCSYKKYLEYNQNEIIKPNDYIISNNKFYFIIKKKNNDFYLADLETNKIIKQSK